MGYYTAFEVTIEKIDPKTFTPTWPKDQHKMPDNSEIPEELADRMHEICEDLEFDRIDAFTGFAKWYDWEEELKELSKDYPEFMFTVEGSGEDAPDFWICWIINGKSQFERKELMHEPFNPKKLK